MRTLDSARESWSKLQQYSTLTDLKQEVRLNGKSSLATVGCRSACWKAFLIFESVDSALWLKTLSSSRSAYNSLKSHFLRHLENPDELAANYDPLSEGSDTSSASPWAQLRKDEELRAEIKQDVDRCMQENQYFRLPETQRIMLDILFVYCRLNPDVSYRQGMHELLAPILWVVEQDAIDLEFIEHDAFALFGQIMQSAKNFYEQTTHQGAENPIVSRSQKIFTDMLPLVDNDLAQHLERVDIVPQVFLIRWIRLIFGREFTFDDLLTIWDVIFAEDPTLEIVDHICLTMLLRMRWQLIGSDYNSALTLLLKYPVEDENKDFQPQSLALDAIYLREHMDYHGGSYLVTKYSGRPLLHNERPATPPALQRNITTVTGPNPRSRLSPTRPARPPRNFESVLRSTAKNIYARGEEFGIGKAVKGAVDEVHRRAQEIRDLQTPSPQASVRYRAPRGSSGSAASFARIKALEDRSKQLAKLLEGAVSELWDYQKHAAEAAEKVAKSEKGPEDTKTSDLEKLSIAIAKAQFIQVYLDDPTLPLPEDETAELKPPPSEVARYNRLSVDFSYPAHKPTAETKRSETLFDTETSSWKGDPTEKAAAQDQAASSPVQGLADPSSFEDFSEPTPDTQPKLPKVVVQEGTWTSPPTAQSPGSRAETHRSRPPLEQSSFSWMLGQQEDPASRPFSNASPFPPDQSRNRGFLFGGDELNSRTGSRDRREGGNEAKQEEEEGFDMSSLRHGRKK